MLHVAQISFFFDPMRRTPLKMLADWESLIDVAGAAHSVGLKVSVLQACAVTEHIVRDGVDFYFAPNLDALLERLVPDVFHVHGLTFAAQVARLAQRFPKTPILLQDHANSIPRLWRQRHWRERTSVASAIAFCARAQAHEFVASELIAPSTRIVAIPESTSRFNPGDQQAARALTGLDGDPCLLWVGHLNDNKDPLTVLAGLSLAARELPNIKLWCCFGNAPLLEEVRNRVESDPLLRGRVQLLGRVEHARIESLMQAADLFVLGSHREGSGYSLIEALASGLPPVVTDIPSFRALTGGRTGRLWRCDDPQDFAASLVAAAREAKPALRAKAREQFERELSSKALGRKLANVYASMLEQPLAESSRKNLARTSDKDGVTVSVLLPAYNRLRFLKAAVHSVLAQSFRDFELVIVDDGSNAETRAYLATLESHPQIRIVYAEHTGNPAAVRNRALRAARGEWIAFLDSDDLWLPRKLELQLAALRAQPECEWAYTAFLRVDSNAEVLPEERTRNWIPYAGKIFKHLVTTDASVRTPSVMAKRRALIEVEGFDQGIAIGEDYELWMRLALKGPVVLVDEPLVLVRLHEENYTGDALAALIERQRALQKITLLASPADRAVVASARAQNSLRICAEYFRRHAVRVGWRTLLASAANHGRRPSWWWHAAGTILRIGRVGISRRHDSSRVAIPAQDILTGESQ